MPVKKQRMIGFYKYVDENGTWGEPGKFSLIRVGKDYYCIKVDVEFSAQGYNDYGTRLYYEGKDALTYSSHGNNMAATDNESEVYEYNTTINYDKEKNIVTLHKKGTMLSDPGKSNRVVRVDQLMNYRFNNGVFERISR
ncbi:MAG: hypothetical protein ACKOA1_06770 [Bacteroidota bacterium]